MKHKFIVKDMTCDNCKNFIANAIRRIDREAVVTVDRANELVTVDSIEPRDALAFAITEEGYTISS